MGHKYRRPFSGVVALNRYVECDEFSSQEGISAAECRQQQSE